MRNNTRRLTVMALMTAIMIIFAFTPIGSIPVGPLVISLQVIPVAICAVALGPWGGAAAGAIFGLLSFMQCFGIGVPSSMGIMLLSINPFLAFIQRFIPRLLDGLIIGFVFNALKKKSVPVACAITGFLSAFLNTLFFMSALVLLFGNTEYMQGLIAGRNILVFICAFVGVNAVCEMVSATVLTGVIGTALYKARILTNESQADKEK